MRWPLMLVIAVGCSSGKPSNKPDEPDRVVLSNDAPRAPKTDVSKDGAPMSNRERVQAVVGTGMGVQPYTLISISGVELFAAANTVEHRGFAILDGGEPLSGAEAFTAVRARGVSDPAQLASLSLLMFRKGGTPILDASEASSQPADVRALVKPPAIQGDVLEYWAWDEPHEQVERHRLDLKTLQLATENGQIVAKQGADPIDTGLSRLATPNTMMYQGAIDLIAGACPDPRAAAALAKIVGTHAHADARAHAAFKSATCHDASTAPALIAALGKDTSPKVRKQAADALGKLKAAAARDALTKAQQDPDADVRGAAGRALKQL